MKRSLVIGAIALVSMSSCVTVKEYDRVYLNDPDMVLADKVSDVNLKTFHAYREAASGANGGKTGGGCGCN